jgi:hypothetical protein
VFFETNNLWKGGEKLLKAIVIAVVLAVVAPAVVSVEAASGGEACATKVVRGPRGPQGLRGMQGQQGPVGEIPWPGVLLVALTGGLVGAGLVWLALGCRHHNPVVWQQGQPPVNVTNNFYGRPGQPPAA